MKHWQMERHGIKGVIRAAPGMGVTAAGMAVVVVMMPTGTGVLLMGCASVGSVSLGRLRISAAVKSFHGSART